MNALRVHTSFLIVLIIGLLLGGCTSLQQAGTASYSVKPFMVGGQAVCCEVTINNGKEIALLDATVIKRGDDYTVHLHEEGVAAFRGQAIAAGAAKSVASAAAKAAVAGVLAPVIPALLPAAGAALASPGVGAAAVGAGALAVGQELKQP